jgi:hypothetical protein
MFSEETAETAARIVFMCSFPGFMSQAYTVLHSFATQLICTYDFLKRRCVCYNKALRMFLHHLNFRPYVVMLMMCSGLEEVLVFQGGHAR